MADKNVRNVAGVFVGISIVTILVTVLLLVYKKDSIDVTITVGFLVGSIFTLFISSYVVYTSVNHEKSNIE